MTKNMGFNDAKEGIEAFIEKEARIGKISEFKRYYLL